MISDVVYLIAALSMFGGDDVPFENECFKVEEVQEVRAFDLWHSGRHGPYSNRMGQTLSYWRVDPESAFENGGWTFLSVVMFGWGDIGEEPTALAVYSRERSTRNADFDVDSDGGGAALTLRIDMPEDVSCASRNGDRQVTISVSDQGSYSVSSR